MVVVGRTKKARADARLFASTNVIVVVVVVVDVQRRKAMEGFMIWVPRGVLLPRMLWTVEWRVDRPKKK